MVLRNCCLLAVNARMFENVESEQLLNPEFLTTSFVVLAFAYDCCFVRRKVFFVFGFLIVDPKERQTALGSSQFYTKTNTKQRKLYGNVSSSPPEDLQSQEGPSFLNHHNLGGNKFAVIVFWGRHPRPPRPPHLRGGAPPPTPRL